MKNQSPEVQKKMKQLTYKDVNVGESYFFVDVSCKYPSPKVYISKAKVNKKITGDFSTRNDDDRYEVVRVFAYPTEEDAKKRVVKELKDYKKYITKDIDEVIKKYL